MVQRQRQELKDKAQETWEKIHKIDATPVYTCSESSSHDTPSTFEPAPTSKTHPGYNKASREMFEEQWNGLPIHERRIITSLVDWIIAWTSHPELGDKTAREKEEDHQLSQKLIGILRAKQEIDQYYAIEEQKAKDKEDDERGRQIKAQEEEQKRILKEDELNPGQHGDFNSDDEPYSAQHDGFGGYMQLFASSCGSRVLSRMAEGLFFRQQCLFG